VGASRQPWAALRRRIREYSGTSLVASAVTEVPLTATWQQVSATYTPAAPGASTLDYNALVIGASPCTCFYADDASIRLG
jgi:hypothetical protein